MSAEVIGWLLAAAVGGAAIGFERQWSGHASGRSARFGGFRTFTMLGALAGLAGWMFTAGFASIAIVLLAASAALIVTAYWAASGDDVDGTTEVAAIVTLAAGFLSGSGHLTIASAITALTVLLLTEKSRLHELIGRVDAKALTASTRFAVMALVVLPLLPEGPFGPFDAVRPRELWGLVLIFSGLSFLGWLARRIAGPGTGVVVSGLLGGVVSSTAVAFTFARHSRDEQSPRVSLAMGVVGACTVMLVRVSIVTGVLNQSLAWHVMPFVAPPFLLGVCAIVLSLRRPPGQAATEVDAGGSPLRLRDALQMTALFQVVLLIILVVRERWSATALLMTSALVGLTDLDALTLSLSRSTPADCVAASAVALTAGIASNTLLKMGVAVVVGKGRFRWLVAAVLGAMTLAMGVGLILH